MELSIVMPCLNEAKTLPECIRKAGEFLRTNAIDGEIIVADNGSSDGSAELAEKLGARVVHVPVKGYGAALSEAIYAAAGTYVIMGDSDDSYDFLALKPFVEKLREGYDLVMGNRFLGGIRKGAMPFTHRFIGNPMLSALGRRIYNHDVCGDFYCGLRGFRRSSILALSIQSTGMEFALEMMVKAALHELKITEVPTTLSPDGRGRRPHLKTYRDGWRSLRLYLLMSPRWTFGIPGLFLTTLGLGVLSLMFTRTIPSDLMGLAHIFSTTGTVLGYQAILLAIFAKFIAIETNLHPPATQFWILQKRGTLESFVIAGFVVAIVCVSAALAANFHYGVHVWAISSPQFESLIETGLIVAGQTVLAGFYFGLLQMLRERRLFRRKRRSD